MRIAILDDYQDVALSYADWDSLPGKPEITAFTEHIERHEALAAALRKGTIAGAGLDVYDTEPLPLGDPLRLTPNTVLTPHLGYVTDDTYRVFYGEAVEDIAAFAQGEPIRVLAL